MKIFVTLFSILLSSLSVFSQMNFNGACGTSESYAAVKNLLESKALYKKLEFSHTETIKYIPIKFHLIAKNDGTGRVKEYDILKQLCILNEDFSSTDFQFYAKDADFSYVNSSNIYDEPANSAFAKDQMQTLRDHQAINVFVVNEINNGAGGIGTPLAYYQHDLDWIVIEKKEPKIGSNTLSHEMGHFFSLLHTYHGWGMGGFNTSSSGWPIAPINDPSGGVTENQDGSNCDSAGDFLCDTPPDYGFGWLDYTCNYTGGAKDPKGALVEPMEHNQMGSFVNGCYPYAFTADQANMMYADYTKPRRNYINSNYIPNTTQITTQATLLTPENNSSSNSSSGVVLDWNDVPYADYYLLEVSRTSNFSQLNQTYIVTLSQKELPALTPDKNYFWKVTAFNEGASCVDNLTSSKWKFKAGPLANSNIVEINTWDVTPNPTSASNLKLAIDLNKALDITAQLVSINGQVLFSNDLKITTGKQVITMPDTKVSNGTYFLRLISKDGMETRRVVIQK